MDLDGIRYLIISISLFSKILKLKMHHCAIALSWRFEVNGNSPQSLPHWLLRFESILGAYQCQGSVSQLLEGIGALAVGSEHWLISLYSLGLMRIMDIIWASMKQARTSVWILTRARSEFWACNTWYRCPGNFFVLWVVDAHYRIP
jgi:hypothetical protein